MPEPWDAFLSYASEDHDEVAGPLHVALSALGLSIWFDRTELSVGDSLRARIDDGLARCKFGIVVLSPSFFAKHYPQRELNGLAQREVEGAKVILPVWHGVDAHSVRKYSPPLADRVAANTRDGVDSVAASLFVVMRPNFMEEAKEIAKLVRPLPELTTGRELFDVMADAHAHNWYADDIVDEAEAELVGGLQTWIGEIADFAEDMDPTMRLRAHLELTEGIGRLNAAGWRVFGERRRKKMTFPESESIWDVPVVAVLKGVSAAATLPGGKVIAVRADPVPAQGTKQST